MRIHKTKCCFFASLFVKTIFGILVFILLTGNCMHVFAKEGKQKEHKTVRVAYVLWENFQEGKEGEPKYGYGYEY